MEIIICNPMSSRTCVYCFGLQGGSVFADFDVDEEGFLYLVRISFDGYGCFTPREKLHSLREIEAITFVENIKKGGQSLDEAGEHLRNYFINCKNIIWDDALREHNLI